MTVAPAGRPQAVARAVVASGLGLAPGVAFAGAFGRTSTEALGEPGYVLPASGAWLVTAAVCLALGTTRLPPVTRLTAGLGALAGYLALVLPARLTDGPYQLLTSVPPVQLSPPGPELATVAAVVGLATLAAVEPALRRPAAGWALPGPLLATTAGLAVTGSAGAAGWLAPALALLCAALFWLTARQRAATGTAGQVRGGSGPHPGPTRPPARRLLAAAALLVVVAGGAAASVAGPALLSAAGGQPPVDARDLVRQPVNPRQDDSPLAQFPALRAGKLPLRLSVRSDQRPPRLRYATLDVFTGLVWTSHTTYWRVGRRLPDPSPTGSSGPVRTVEDQVRIEDAGPLGWLVSTGRPVDVSVSGLGVDRATGDVVLPDDRPIPPEYTVRSTVPVLDPTALDGAVPARPTGGGQLPDQAKKLSATAVEITGGEYGHPALRRLAEHFTRDGGYDVDTSARPPAGHGVFQINRLLQERRGTAEQYASAFAVLARTLGYDARVVVGFRVRAGRADAARYQISGRDVDAWAEVRFTDAGWVPFFPTPSQQSDGQPAAEPSPSPSPRPPDQPPPAARESAPAGRAAPTASTSDPDGGGRLWWLLGGAGGAALAVVMAGPPLAKLAIRTRRRRRDDPRRRVAGAWQDTLERYAEAGLPLSTASTTGEAVAGAAARFPAAAAATSDLAGVVDRVLYGPHPVSAADSDRAWQLADTTRRRLRAALTRGRRLWILLRPPPRLSR